MRLRKVVKNVLKASKRKRALRLLGLYLYEQSACWSSCPDRSGNVMAHLQNLS